MNRLSTVNACIRCHDTRLPHGVMSCSRRLVSTSASQPMPSVIEIVAGCVRSRFFVVQCRFRQSTLKMLGDALARCCLCMVLQTSQSMIQCAHAKLEMVFEARVPLNRVSTVNACIRCHDTRLPHGVVSWSRRLVSKPASQPMPSSIEIVSG